MRHARRGIGWGRAGRTGEGTGNGREARRGCRVRNAIGEGILVAGAPGKPVVGATIRANAVVHNDLGATMANHGGYRQCEPTGNVPGDCGEGIHLMSAAGGVHGNRIVGNLIGTNNLKGDPDFQPADTATTGILVRSVTPLSITIAGNTILDNTYGMWLSPTVTAFGLATNVFQSVTEAVHRG